MDAEDKPEAARYASRKFVLTVVVLAVAAIYRETGAISPELWVDLTKWTLGLYFGANVATWAAELLKGKV